MTFTLIIKHYESGTRRFFRQAADGITMINAKVFDTLVGSPACERIIAQEA